MKVRVTPIDEDGTWGTPIVRNDVVSAEHEPVDPTGLDISEVLVVQVGDDTHRYSLDSNWVEITPDPPAAEPVLADDDQPDDLGRTPDEVRAQYTRDQAAADRDWVPQDH